MRPLTRSARDRKDALVSDVVEYRKASSRSPPSSVRARATSANASEPTERPFAPTEFPRERSVTEHESAPSQAATSVPQEEVTVHRVTSPEGNGYRLGHAPRCLLGNDGQRPCIHRPHRRPPSARARRKSFRRQPPGLPSRNSGGSHRSTRNHPSRTEPSGTKARSSLARQGVIVLQWYVRKVAAQATPHPRLGCFEKPASCREAHPVACRSIGRDAHS